MEILPAWHWRHAAPRDSTVFQMEEEQKPAVSWLSVLVLDLHDFWHERRTAITGPFLAAQSRHVLHERVVVLVLQNHWQYVTHVVLPSSPPPAPPALLPFEKLLPSLMLSTPGTGPCSSFKDMAPAVRQSTCMCICRAATCIQTSPITSGPGPNSWGGATWGP